MENGISTVVFDFGGVLIDWNPRYLYRKLLRDEPEVEWFLANICTSEWNAQQDAGRPMREACELLVAEHPEHEEMIRAYYDRWEEMIAGPIDGTVEILRRLRETPVGLYGLTNWSAETFPVARQKFEFLNWFDGIVVSGEIRMIKPDPAIFHHLIESFDIVPEQSVFIDDSSPNVETARSIGFRGIHFEDPDQLRRALEQHGIHLNDDND